MNRNNVFDAVNLKPYTASQMGFFSFSCKALLESFIDYPDGSLVSVVLDFNLATISTTSLQTKSHVSPLSARI